LDISGEALTTLTRDSAVGVCGRRKRYTVQSADEKDDYFYNTNF